MPCGLAQGAAGPGRALTVHSTSRVHRREGCSRGSDSEKPLQSCLPGLNLQWLVLAMTSSALAACAPDKPQPQTEEELHAIGPNAREVGHPHVFLCPGKERLLVDFGADGLRLQIRQPEGAPPLTLTAPAQGMPFQGSRARGILEGQKLRITNPDGSERTCVRQTQG